MARADIMAGKAYVSLYMKDKLTRDLLKAKQRVNKFGADMMSLGTKMVAMSAGVAAPIALATKAFAAFDDAMRSVKAVTGATEDQFASMTERAKELGRTTSFTAVQVAELMTELGRAGFKPDEINRMTDAVMNLSRATGTEAAQSAGIVSATLRQFALDAGDAARVADVLTKAANSTFNTVEGLGESLKYAGPVAKELGMSLEDTVAILGSLGNVGIQGSDAGSALRRLGVISAASGDKLKKLFGVINTDASGNLKPLVQIMDEIGRATEKMTNVEKVEKMKEAFGLLGITASSILSKTGESTAELAESLRNAEGAAASAAKEMDKGLGGAFRIIMSAAEGLQIAIGEALQTELQQVVEKITNLFGEITKWVAVNREVIVAVTKTTVAVAAFGAGLVAIGASIKMAAFGFGGLTMAVSLSVKAFVAMKLAVVSMGTALIGTVIPNIIAYTTYANIAAAATVALKAAVGGLALYVTYRLAKGIYSASAALKEYNKQLRIGAELSSKMDRRTSKKQASILGAADEMSGEQKTQYLQSELERAKKELAGAKASEKGQQKIVEGLDTSFNSITGNKILEAEQAALAEQSARVAGLEEFVNNIESAIDASKQESVQAAKEIAAAAQGKDEAVAAAAMVEAKAAAVEKEESKEPDWTAEDAKLARYKKKLNELRAKINSPDAEGKPEAESGDMKYGIKSGGSSAATFSARGLMAMGTSTVENKQLQTLKSVASKLNEMMMQQMQQSKEQIAAVKKLKLKHS